MSELQLSLAAVVDAELELVDAELVTSAAAAASNIRPSPSPPPAVPGLEERNLFGEAERIAARAATLSTRRQYGAIFRAFGDWLASQLGRPPLVADLDADVIAAYGRHLAISGGRGGRPAAPATVRVYLSMIRAFTRELGLNEAVDAVRVPRHEPGPPETLTDTDYANLLRVPDRRTVEGKRNYALLRVLGDCGLRSAELRGLRARDLRRPRANARHHRLYVHGKGGREREVPVPQAVEHALDAWTAVVNDHGNSPVVITRIPHAGMAGIGRWSGQVEKVDGWGWGVEELVGVGRGSQRAGPLRTGKVLAIG